MSLACQQVTAVFSYASQSVDSQLRSIQQLINDGLLCRFGLLGNGFGNTGSGCTLFTASSASHFATIRFIAHPMNIVNSSGAIHRSANKRIIVNVAVLSFI
ncbi:MAG: hypothetical protein KC421_22260, partial [Anaerolineales bacterium]|nr:hypothetical protein [Anaerolineales bacterium]